MKASSAVPILFPPININGDYFVDGGMTSPVPTKFVREMGADIVIGVNLYGGIFPVNFKKKRLSRVQTFKISRFLWLQKLAQNDLKLADIALNLKIPNDSFGLISKSTTKKETIDLGYQSTNKIIHQIKTIEKV